MFIYGLMISGLSFGSTISASPLDDIYSNGFLDEVKTFEETKALAKKGDSTHQSDFGDFYYFGMGGASQDYTKAFGMKTKL